MNNLFPVEANAVTKNKGASNSFLSIIIPAHNEERRIEPTLLAYASFLREKTKKKILKGFEILVVLNACRDRTLDVVKRCRKKYGEIRFLNFTRGGKGFAILEGFKDAKGSFVGFVDADMATPPEAFYDLAEHLEGYDGVIASRWLKGAQISTRQTLLRRITSRGFNFLVRSFFLMPYRDTQCGAKLFTKDVVREIVSDVGTTAWAFDVDLIYKIRKKKYRILEWPTTWNDKKESVLNLKKVPLQMFLGILRLRLLNSPFRFAVRFYDKLPEFVKVHH